MYASDRFVEKKTLRGVPFEVFFLRFLHFVHCNLYPGKLQMCEKKKSQIRLRVFLVLMLF